MSAREVIRAQAGAILSAQLADSILGALTAEGYTVARLEQCGWLDEVEVTPGALSYPTPLYRVVHDFDHAPAPIPSTPEAK